ncbi:hypothetical protein BHE74_00024653 [Ensete ventricosum]|nr:hypothetical protein BHE74_00024653 [Ensete ventricosum]
MAAISATESSSSACASPEEVGAESPLGFSFEESLVWVSPSLALLLIRSFLG